MDLSGRNTHVRARDLFNEIDAYYSLVYSSVDGNTRGHFIDLNAGEAYRGKVYRKRLNFRAEVRINWHLLNADTIIIIIGTFFFSFDRVFQMIKSYFYFRWFFQALEGYDVSCRFCCWW